MNPCRARSAMVFVSLLLVGACGAEVEGSEVDPALQELETWRLEQTQTECPDVAQDEGAKALVENAQTSGSTDPVYGEVDPHGRREEVLKHLWSRPNPHGDGVVVTAVKDGDGVGLDESSHTRRRAVWLVLDEKIFPLNIEGALAFSRLSSGLPEDVARRAGLPTFGIDTELDLGIADFISFKWNGTEDPLPVCPQPR